MAEGVVIGLRAMPLAAPAHIDVTVALGPSATAWPGQPHSRLPLPR